jgi:uncharacterized membrane protein YhaH (DUF805 family)
MFCPSCGIQLVSETTHSCTQCGSPIRAFAQAPVQAACVAPATASGKPKSEKKLLLLGALVVLGVGVLVVVGSQSTDSAVSRGGPDGFLGLPIDSGFAIGMIVLFTVIIAAYLLPALIAFSRRHRNRWVILAINLAFGFTLIGWAIALVWALNKVDDPIKGGIKYDPQPNDPIL